MSSKHRLALIRAQVEVGVDESSRDDLLQDVSRMGRQVQQLLHLAEASEPQNYTFTAVDPQSVAREVVSYIERLANQHGVTLNVVVEAGLTMLRADRGALFTLLKNLLENAIQHSRAGDVVQLLTQSNCISVTDEGAGVPPKICPSCSPASGAACIAAIWGRAGPVDLP